MHFENNGGRLLVVFLVIVCSCILSIEDALPFYFFLHPRCATSLPRSLISILCSAGGVLRWLGGACGDGAGRY